MIPKIANKALKVGEKYIRAIEAILIASMPSVIRKLAIESKNAFLITCLPVWVYLASSGNK